MKLFVCINNLQNLDALTLLQRLIITNYLGNECIFPVIKIVIARRDIF
ncbi:hypothetical protein GXM_06252 [Nostoc sphaeroides CCNUC1]|uniref:Uncharacterized protein n=1 Tax=Nostoc sphaeroides CCNUC1 TaxID=2653204 RepID=A0A5P8W7Q5_9NOSO|nr:hypothetical protein GXM_06252 [Nostoc sphaeroides CCNUC1]